VNGGIVVDGELVVTGRDGSVPREPVDPALHGMPLLIGLVELRWPATARAALLTVGSLAGLVRDGAVDPASVQVRQQLPLSQLDPNELAGLVFAAAALASVYIPRRPRRGPGGPYRRAGGRPFSGSQSTSTETDMT